MNLWIDTARDSLVQAIGAVDLVLMNDAELRMLTARAEPGPGRGRRAGDGPSHRGRQAGRVRGRALHRGRLLRASRLPARRGAGPDRGGRQLRRRLSRLPRRPRRGADRPAAAAPRHDLRLRDGVIQRRAVRHRAGSRPHAWTRSTSASRSSRRSRTSRRCRSRQEQRGSLSAAAIDLGRAIFGGAMATEQTTLKPGQADVERPRHPQRHGSSAPAGNTSCRSRTARSALRTCGRSRSTTTTSA